MRGAEQHRQTDRSPGATHASGAANALPSVAVAVFGKHPAWRDFISLNPANDAFLTQIYEGIYRRCLDILQSGVWGTDMAQVVPQFHHYLVHIAPSGDTAVGLMLGSRDQLGRQQPLLIVANAGSANYHRAVSCLLPLVSNLAHQVSALEDESSILNLVSRSQASLPVQLESSAVPPSNHAAQQLRMLLSGPPFSDSEDALERLVYQLVGPDAGSIDKPWETPEGFADHIPTQIRIPFEHDDPGGECDRWLTFARFLCGRRYPLTILAPMGKNWADLIVGDPTEADLPAILRLPENELSDDPADVDDMISEELRRNPEPFTHAVPFTLDPEFRARTASFREVTQQAPLEPLAPSHPEGRRLADVQTTLTEVSGRILTPFRRGKPTRQQIAWFVAIIVGLLLMFLFVTLVLSWMTRPPPPESAESRPAAVQAADIEQWRQLCTDFYEWFSIFEDNVAQTESRRQHWRRDPDLRPVVDLLADETARAALDPRIIIDREGAPLKDLIEQPPPSLSQPQIQQEVNEAATAVAGIKATVSGENWTLYQQLQQLAGESYAERGWQALAQKLQAALTELNMSPKLAVAIDQILLLGEQARLLEETWQRLDSTATRLRDTESRLLQQFGRVVQRQSKAAVAEASSGASCLQILQDLDGSFADLAPVAADLDQFVLGDWPRVDPRSFRIEETRVFGGVGDRELSLSHYRQWLDLARPLVLERPQQWLAELEQTDTICASEALNRLWRETRAAALKDVNAETLTGIPYFDLRTKLDSTRQLLSDLDAAASFERAFDTASARPQRPWQQALTIKAEDHRDQLLTALVSRALRESQAPLSKRELEKTDLWQRTLADHAASVELYRRAKEEFTRVEQALERWQDIEEPLPESSRTFEAVAKDWMARTQELTDTGLVEAVNPFLDVARSLLKLRACRTSDAILTCLDPLSTAHPALLYRGWIGLGRITDGSWPADADQESVDARLTNLIQQEVQKLPEGERREVLLKRIETEKTAREVCVLSRRLRSCDDPILARFHEWQAPLSPIETNLDARLRDLRRHRDLGSEILNCLASDEVIQQVDMAQLRDANQRWNEELTTVSEETFATWLARISEYRRLPANPRDDLSSAIGDLQAMRSNVSSLIQLARQESSPPADTIAAVEKHMTELTDQVKLLWEMPAIEKNRKEITAGMDALRQTHQALEARMTALQGHVTPPEDWRDAQARDALHSASTALNARFSQRLEELLAGLDVHALRQNPEHYLKVRGQVGQLRAAFTALSSRVQQAFPSVETIAISSVDNSWRTAVPRALEKRREELLAQLLDAADEPAGLEALPNSALWKQHQQDWLAETAAVPEVLTVLQDMADLYRQPEAGLDLGRVRICMARFSSQRGAPILAPRHPARAVLGDAAGKAERICALMALADPEDLLKVLSRDEPAFIAIAAWQRLAETGWPQGSAQLRRDVLMARDLLAMHDLNEETRTAIRNQALKRWRTAFSRLHDDHAIVTAVQLLAALDIPTWRVLDAFDQTIPVEPPLPPQERYNIWLVQSRCRVQMCADENAARALAQNLAEQANVWKAHGLDNAQIDDLQTRLRRNAQATAPPDNAANPAELGPARAGWHANPVPGDASGLAYTALLGQREWTLVFRRIPLSDPDGAAVYICTTELPIGLFADCLSDANTLDEFRRLYRGNEEAMAADTRALPGPLLWHLAADSSESGAKLAATADWLPQIDLQKMTYYPKTMVPPPPPGPMTPVNRLTPASAVFLAASLGCRLPLPQELLAAQEAGSDALGERVNLRDQEWQRVYQHVVGQVQGGRSVPLPDVGSLAAGLGVNDSGASVQLPQADGFVWFAPVGSPYSPGMCHVVGNVAEFAASVRMEDLPVPCTAEAVDASIRAQGVAFSILGGSAVSSPPLAPTQPVSVNRHGMRAGYSDVGLRLAFSARLPATARAILQDLSEQPLLTASR